MKACNTRGVVIALKNQNFMFQKMKILTFFKKKIGNRFIDSVLLILGLLAICLIWPDLNNFLGKFENTLNLLMFALTIIACLFTWRAYETTQKQLKQAKAESIRNEERYKKQLDLAKQSAAASEINNAWAVLSRPAPGNSGKAEALETLAKYRKQLIGIDLSTTKNNRQVWLVGLELSTNTHGYQVILQANFSGVWDEEREEWRNGANLFGADFKGASLSNTKFNGASLSNAKFNGADLWYTEFNGADLQFTKFNNTNLTRADFSNARNFDSFASLALKEFIRGNDGLKEKFKDCHCYCIDFVKEGFVPEEDCFPKVPDGFEVKFVLDENGKPKSHPTIGNFWLIEILENPDSRIKNEE